VLNWIWLLLVLVSVGYAGLTGRMPELVTSVDEGAKAAVQLVIGLVGIMVFMLGVMRVAFDAGLRDAIARGLAPLLRRLFPEVPPDHPAMGAMVMNLASNILGLGNAATPFGLKAMVELGKLNPHPGCASNAMVLFLAINTSAVTLLPPLGTIAVRLAAHSADPWAIWVPTLIATCCSTVAAVAMYYALLPLPGFRAGPVQGEAERPADDPSLPDLPALGAPAADRRPLGLGRWLVILGFAAAVGAGLVSEAVRLSAELSAGGIFKQMVQTWLLPLLIGGLLLFGVARRVPIYDSMIEGAKEGLEVAVRIVPYLVAILVAVAMLRASGFLDLVIHALDPLTSRVGVPAAVLPMALLRPLSGSGAFGVMSEILNAEGPDSFVGMLASTIQGSTETTFYVLALYYGAARIKNTRHTLAAALTGDLAGFVGAVAACHLFFG
jgi:spore maturation protein SpmA